jgi:hypothetical protein
MNYIILLHKIVINFIHKEIEYLIQFYNTYILKILLINHFINFKHKEIFE